MKKYSVLFITLLTLTIYSTVASSIPASTDYVNARISEAVDALKLQITKDINNTESKLNDIPVVRLFQVGDSYQGGIIFWVDESFQHGLIAAKHDANEGVGVQWKNGESGEKVTNARANGVGAGATNTKLIISEQTIDNQAGIFAALVAVNYSILADGDTPCPTGAALPMTCYGDWYLPSIYELDLMFLNLGEKGRFAPMSYWSSTEYGVGEAWLEDSLTGTQLVSDKANSSALVRPIRAF